MFAVACTIMTREGPQSNVTSLGKPFPSARTSEGAPQSAPRGPQVASRPTKRPCPATHTSNLDTSDVEVCVEATSSVLTELENLKREMARKEKELEATISGLTEKNNTFFCSECCLQS